MKKKGFTLIELLAVIVILAIIALIAVPVIMNIISSARENAFKDTAYGLVKAGELYYANQLLTTGGMTEDKVFTFDDGNVEPTGLDVKGNLPTTGSMTITKDGIVILNVSDGQFLATKNENQTDVVVTKGNVSKPIPNSNIISDNKCAVDETQICAEGTLITYKVNDSQTYDFYVIKDTGRLLTLIMNSNLGLNDVSWNTSGFASDGPTGVLKALEERTNNWTNVNIISEYTYVDTNGNNQYSAFTKTNVRSRLLSSTEYDISKTWLTSNLVNYDACGWTENDACGYWTGESISNTPEGFGLCLTSYGPYTCSGMYGIRPVIEVSKLAN